MKEGDCKIKTNLQGSYFINKLFVDRGCPEIPLNTYVIKAKQSGQQFWTTVNICDIKHWRHQKGENVLEKARRKQRI